MPKRAKYPGVFLFQRKRRSTTTYYARVQQPNGLWKDVNLTALGLTSKLSRERWAERKSNEVVKGKRVRALGTTPVSDRIEEYLGSVEIRETTKGDYRRALNGFMKETREQLEHAEAITPELLANYRAALIAGKLKPASVNGRLRRLQAAFQEWRRRGWLPQLDSDAIRDRLALVDQGRPQPNPLRSPAIRQLLHAAETYDRDRPHLRPVVPLVSLFLFGGLRAGEAWELELGDINPGHILVRGGKRRRVPRRVRTRVSPRLAGLVRERPEELLGWTHDSARKVREDLIAGTAPKFTWQQLRQTCGSHLVNAPGIWGGEVAIYKAADQLGHSPEVAQRHYWEVIDDIPEAAKTLDQAMGVALSADPARANVMS